MLININAVPTNNEENINNFVESLLIRQMDKHLV